MGSDWGEDVLKYKYDPLPEEPVRRKKREKKRHKRSDHKHEYEEIAIDSHSGIYRDGAWHHCYDIGKRCRICGRLDDVRWSAVEEVPKGMRTFEVKDFLELFKLKILAEETEIFPTGD